MKIKIWARIGTAIIVEVEKPTRQQIGDALKKAINKNNTDNENFYPIGETYVPEDNCIKDEYLKKEPFIPVH